MIVGSTDGKIYFAPNPCLAPLTIEDTICSHSSAVKSVYLTKNGQNMISCSSDSLFIWRMKGREGLMTDNLTSYYSIENSSSDSDDEGSENGNGKANEENAGTKSPEMDIHELRELVNNNVFNENKLHLRFNLITKMIE